MLFPSASRLAVIATGNNRLRHATVTTPTVNASDRAIEPVTGRGASHNPW